MREPRCCAEIRRHLTEHGLPDERIARIVREFGDHWEDVRAEAMESGFSEREADACADARLGVPEHLASEVTAGFRRASRLGRHPILSLCVLPVVAAVVLLAVVVPVLMLVQEWTHLWSGPDGQPDPKWIAPTVWFLNFATTAAVLAGLTWRVWNSGLGLRWVVAMIAWCLLAALARFFDADVAQRQVAAGFCFPWRLNSHTALVFLLHGAVLIGFLLRARVVRRRCSHNETIITSLKS